MSSVPDYYAEYWTEVGYNPGSAIDGNLASLYAEHLRGSVLDVGCGDAQKTGSWVHDHGGQYTGVDVSSTAVERARKAGFEAQTVESADKLPFPDDSFDSVVCIEVLEHLFAPHATTAEIRRVLKPTGVFIATVPNAEHIRDRLDMLAGQWQPRGDSLGRSEPWRSPHIRFFRCSSLLAMVEQAGFTDVSVHGYNTFPFLTYIPGVRRFMRGRSPSGLYVMLGRRWPTLWAGGLYVIASGGSRI
jgi:ubiquinone/menaquinone biosynthesis C-methylase UbiE